MTCAAREHAQDHIGMAQRSRHGYMHASVLSPVEQAPNPQGGTAEHPFFHIADGDSTDHIQRAFRYCSIFLHSSPVRLETRSDSSQSTFKHEAFSNTGLEAKRQWNNSTILLTGII